MLDQLSLLSFASGGWGQALLAGALVTVSLALACLPIGLPLGLASGLAPGGWADRLTLGYSVLLRALPPFLLGLMLMLGLSVQLGWAPAAGHGEGGNLLLPALTLGLGLSGLTARIVRDSMLAVVQADYYRFARSKGLAPWRVAGQWRA